MNSQEIDKKNQEIILELALYINQELFNEKIISYQNYYTALENILKNLKKS